jgi:flagellar motor switch protein FliM
MQQPATNPQDGVRADDLQPGAAYRRYDISRPVVRPERRVALEGLHREVGMRWREGLVDIVGIGLRIVPDGVGFESFSQLLERSADQDDESIAAAFLLERSQTPGLLAISPRLMRYLIDLNLGEATAPSGNARVKFTPLEMSIASAIMRPFLAQLGQAYSARGLGAARVLRCGSQLRELAVFVPEDYLAVFSYTVEAGEISGTIVVALAAAVVNAIAEPVDQPERKTAPVDGVERVGELSVETMVVLGCWTVRIEEVAALATGDLLLLPGGEEAFLVAGGRKFGPLAVERSVDRVELRMIDQRGRLASVGDGSR